MRRAIIACAVVSFFPSVRGACPAGTIGAVYGRIVQASTPEDGLGGVKVVLEGAQRRLELTARDDGRFVFPGLPEGEYRVTAEKRGYVVAQPAQPLKLAAKSCAEANLRAQPDRRIRVHVFNSDGDPVSGVSMMVLAATKVRTTAQLAAVGGASAQPEGPLHLTDAKGWAEFRNLDPGDYYLGVNLESPPTPMTPYGRLYYPGTEERDLATTLRIPEDGAVVEVELTLPPPQRERALSGVVTLPDGSPAKGAMLYLEDPRFPFLAIVVRAIADDQGLFTVNCYDGNRYILYAVSACALVRDCRSSEPYEILPGVEPSLQLVLSRRGHAAMEEYQRSLKQP
jgi:hypothetical protein